jgi:MoxR-like ATPase
MERPPAASGPVTRSPERHEALLPGVIFEEIKNKSGELTGYKSSSRDRKKVVLSENSPKPVPGTSYEVRIIEDTNPDDPMSGQYIVQIVPGQNTQITQEDWNKADLLATEVGYLKRSAQQDSVDLFNKTGVPKTERSEEDIPQTRLGRNAFEHEQEIDTQVADILEKNEGTPLNDLIKLRRENLTAALREDKRLEAEKGDLLTEEAEILKSVQNTASPAAYKSLQQINALLEGVHEKEKDLLSSTPEAYYGLHLKELKEYKDSLEEGRIVETPYVERHAEDIYTHMRAGKPVLIYGHLGTGKTELAMHVARKYVGKDALVISGSKNMSLAELYGHQVLSLDSVSPEMLTDFTKEVEDRFSTWEAENKETSEEAKNRMHDTILQTYLTKLQKGTVTDFFLGPLYRAMAEGRPVIIDEVNAIPHEILISLNHILTRKVGDEVLVQQDSGMTINIKEGFGVLMTGNLNQGQDIYVDRQDMDPALLSRLYKVEYDYLPQEVGDDALGQSDENHPNELFEVIMAKLIDKRGNLQIPEKSLEALRDLAMAARVTQDVFAGRAVESSFFMQVPGSPRGIQYFLKESVLSLRALDAILSQWQNDGYKYELDHYIWNEFIGQSTQPSDRAYLYQLFQNRFRFFQEGWEQNPPMGVGTDTKSFSIKSPKNKAGEVQFSDPRQVIDFVYGPGPTRSKWPEQQSPANSAETE